MHYKYFDFFKSINPRIRELCCCYCLRIYKVYVETFKDCSSDLNSFFITLLLTQIRNKRKTTFFVVYIFSRTVYKPMNPFPTCSIPHVPLVFPAPPRLSTPPGIQSAENTGDDYHSVSGSNPGSFIVMMQIPSYQHAYMLTSSSTLFQNYQAYIEMHSLIFETDKTEISHPVPRVLILLYKRILTLFQGF